MKTTFFIALVLASQAHAETVPLAVNGPWTTVGDIASSVKTCGIVTSVNGGKVSIFGSTDRQGILQITLDKSDWNIPGLTVPLTFTFDTNVPLHLIGVGHANTIEADIPSTDVKPLIHELTADQSATITLPQGHERPWQLDLRGTTPAVLAMARCVDAAQLRLPLPFKSPQELPIQTTQSEKATQALQGEQSPPVANLAVPPAEPQREVPAPASADNEDEFVQIVEGSKQEYTNAGNDLKKGAVRFGRKVAFCKTFSNLEVSNWRGIISNLSSNSSGKGVLAVSIQGKATLKTWNNSFSDISDDTLIPPNAQFFGKLSNLSVGDQILFSGRFISSEDDCIKESSIRQSGAMTDPEFIFRFSDVRPVP